MLDQLPHQESDQRKNSLIRDDGLMDDCHRQLPFMHHQFITLSVIVLSFHHVMSLI